MIITKITNIVYETWTPGCITETSFQKFTELTTSEQRDNQFEFIDYALSKLETQHNSRIISYQLNINRYNQNNF